jgi:hypothetical protein
MTPIKQYLDEHRSGRQEQKLMSLEQQLARIPSDAKLWDFFYLEEVKRTDLPPLKNDGEFLSVRPAIPWEDLELSEAQKARLAEPVFQIDLNAISVLASRVHGEWFVLGPDELIG